MKSIEEDAEFWTPGTGGMDALIAGRTTTVRSVAGLLDTPAPYRCGDRVAFVATLSSLLSYPSPPDNREGGTVVRLRTAGGTATEHEGRVFVKWDSGAFLPVAREHLRTTPPGTKNASSFVRTVSALGDLGDFLKAGSDEELVHKATRDLWSLSKSSGGGFVIERLFDATGEPLKV